MFQVQSIADDAVCEERFCDSFIVHSQAVVSIEYFDSSNPGQFLSASQDGSVIIWEFVLNNGKKAGNLENATDSSNYILSPTIDQDRVIERSALFRGSTFSTAAKELTAARWLDSTSVVVSFTDGSVYIKSISDTYQQPV